MRVEEEGGGKRREEEEEEVRERRKVGELGNLATEHPTAVAKPIKCQLAK
jgi:hypothetical protein